MTRLQRIKVKYEDRYGEKACARYARERFGFDLPSHGNSKVFWFEVSARMIAEDRRAWEAAQKRRNRQNQQAKTSKSSHPSFQQLLSAAMSRGYVQNEAQALAQKAIEMINAGNVARAYKLFINRVMG